MRAALRCLTDRETCLSAAMGGEVQLKLLSATSRVCKGRHLIGAGRRRGDVGRAPEMDAQQQAVIHDPQLLQQSTVHFQLAHHPV